MYNVHTVFNIFKFKPKEIDLNFLFVWKIAMKISSDIHFENIANAGNTGVSNIQFGCHDLQYVVLQLTESIPEEILLVFRTKSGRA